MSGIDQTSRGLAARLVVLSSAGASVDIDRTPNIGSRRLFQEIASQSVRQEYEKGQAIYSQGDLGNAVFRIERGNVKLAVVSKHSQRAAIAILHAGDCFGEACLMGNSRRRCTATSIHTSTIDRISKPVMMRRLHDEPAFAKLFISHLLLRIGRTEDDLVDQRVNSSERRLARLLLQLSDFGKLSGGSDATPNLDQETLAQVVGTTRSRVSHFMSLFRKKGYISYNGSLKVHKALLAYLRQQGPA